MIVFTCVNKESEDAAVIWAASLKAALGKGGGGIQTYMFHTPDVDTSRFLDFNVYSVSIGDMPNLSRKEILVKVLDMMVERKFTDRVFYSDTDVLWMNHMDELKGAPLNEKVWLAARNDNVFYDDKRNRKFYPHYDTDFDRKLSINPDGYLNSDVLYMLLDGLRGAVRRKGYKKLEDFYLAMKDKHGHSVEDCFNLICGEYVNLFDRYNAFAEDVLDLDFGEMLGRRNSIHSAHLINFRGVHKPWREVDDIALPELAGAQYPMNTYLACCEAHITYITKPFLEKVRANAKRYSLINDWDKNVLAKSGPLKDKLTKFKEELKKQG